MFKGLLTFLILTLLLACGRPAQNRDGQLNPGGSGLINTGANPSNPSTPDDGGQDSGGGDHLQSGKKAIRKVFSDKENLVSNLETIIFNIQRFEINEIPWAHKELHEHREFLKHWTADYTKAKIPIADLLENISYKDICLNEKNEITSASITKNNTNSTHELCINLEKLSLIPIESLEIQIHGLLIHEYTHLINLTHEDGVTIQNIVIDLYPLLSAKKNANSSMLETFQDTLNNSIELLAYLPKRPKEKFIIPGILNDKVFISEFQNLLQNKKILKESISWMLEEINVHSEKYAPTEILNITNTLKTADAELDDLSKIGIMFNVSAMGQKNSALFGYADNVGPSGNIYKLPNKFNLIAVALKKCTSLDLTKAKIVKTGLAHTSKKESPEDLEKRLEKEFNEKLPAPVEGSDSNI